MIAGKDLVDPVGASQPFQRLSCSRILTFAANQKCFHSDIDGHDHNDYDTHIDNENDHNDNNCDDDDLSHQTLWSVQGSREQREDKSPIPLSVF